MNYEQSINMSRICEITQRIGMEINQYKVKRMLKNIIEKVVLSTEGKRKWTKYFIKQNL